MSSKNVSTAPVATPAIAVANPSASASSTGAPTILWAVLLLSAVLVILAALPNELTYRISLPVGHAISVARVPLVTAAVALTIGVVASLLLSNA